MVLTAEHERLGSSLLVETAERDGFRYSRSLDDEREPDRDLLGTKAANLAELMRLGLPVPPGFTLTTEAWQAFDQGESLPNDVWQETQEQLALLEEKTGSRFGDPENPLVVSVRSSPPHSQPGLLSTVLNIGLTEKTLPGLAKREGEWCAWDSLRRGIASFAISVLGQDRRAFDSIMSQARQTYGVHTNQDLPVEALREVVEQYKTLVDLPQNPYVQLNLSIKAVFRSWNNPSAIAYRRAKRIPLEEGTAVIVENMAFGNKDNDRSGSGVCLTCNPQTGTSSPVVAYSARSQGTDVVGPDSLHDLIPVNGLPPEIAALVRKMIRKVRAHYGPSPYGIEFAVVDGKLRILQLREAHLFSPEAALVNLRELAQNGNLPEDEITQRVLEVLNMMPYLRRRLDPHAVKRARREGRDLGRGIPVSSGIASGRAVASLEEAEALSSQDVQVVLVCKVLTEADVLGLPSNVAGNITELGCAGSHTAQLLRAARGGLGVPTISGVERGRVNSGEVITFDAATGMIFRGVIPVIKGKPLSPELTAFLRPVIEIRQGNPWLGLAASCPAAMESHWRTLTPLAEAALTLAQEKYQSPKAQAIAVLNAMIPGEIRLHYQVFRRDAIEEIRAALHDVLKRGYEASVRTCHNPTKIARAPWQLISSPDQVEPFLNDPGFDGEYGGFRQWQQDPRFTEAVVGQLPPGKLDLAHAQEHCVFTLSCVGEQLVLQLLPFTAQLRALERVPPGDIITMTAFVDPRSPTGLGKFDTRLGINVEGNLEARRFTELVRQTVFGWWESIALPHRLAALQRVAGLVTLEGQTGPDWCSIYGIKGPEESRELI